MAEMAPPMCPESNPTTGKRCVLGGHTTGYDGAVLNHWDGTCCGGYWTTRAPAAAPAATDGEQKATCAVSVPGGPGAMGPPMPTESRGAGSRDMPTCRAVSPRGAACDRDPLHGGSHRGWSTGGREDWGDEGSRLYPPHACAVCGKPASKIGDSPWLCDPHFWADMNTRIDRINTLARSHAAQPADGGADATEAPPAGLLKSEPVDFDEWIKTPEAAKVFLGRCKTCGQPLPGFASPSPSPGSAGCNCECATHPEGGCSCGCDCRDASVPAAEILRALQNPDSCNHSKPAWCIDCIAAALASRKGSDNG